MQPPKGSISSDGEKLVIRFPWDERKFKSIKKFKGARFDKEQRCWYLPLSALAALKRSAVFSPSRITWVLDEGQVHEDAAQANERQQSARAQLAENPFQVPEDVIAQAQPDVVFRDGRDGQIYAALQSRSRAREVFERIPGAHYVRREGALFLSAHSIVEAIRLCREERILFAVTESLGKALSASATLRSRILSGEVAPLLADLRHARLAPRAALEEGVLLLEGLTTEARRLAFPEKIQRPLTALTIGDVLHAMSNLAWHGLRVWCSGGLSERIARNVPLWQELVAAGDFPDELLAVVEPSLVWAVNGSGRAVLVGEPSELEGCRPHLGGELCTWPLQPRLRCIEYQDSRFLESYEALEQLRGTAVPSSHAALRLAQEARRRRAMVRRKEQFAQQAHEPLKLHNDRLSPKLFPHQRVAVRWILEQPHCFIGDDMGLGKTLSVLASIDELVSRGEIDRALVVCPSSLIRNWLREAAQWLPSRTFLSLPREKQERSAFLKAINKGAVHFDVLVVNYETLRLPYVAPEVSEIFSGRRALLAMDESQRIKNPQGKSFEVLDHLSGLFERRVLISGTPTPKNVADIWAQMKVLDRGERFGDDYYRWLESVAELGNEFSDYAVQRFIPERVREVVSRVHEVLLRRRKDEVLQLPEKLFTTRELELQGDQAKRYEEICGGLLLRLTSLDGDTYVREIESILEEYLRAVQVASNPRLIDELWKGEPVKFSELDEIVREVVAERDEKLVVWTNYLRNVDELCERYAEWRAAPFSGRVSTAARDATVQAFQRSGSDGPQILVAVPGAGGVGITLTAAQVAVYVDKTWNAEHWLQSVDRIHRIGQTGTVSIISLNACKVDDIISANLWRKARDQERLLRGEAVREPEFPSRNELLDALQGERGAKV